MFYRFGQIKSHNFIHAWIGMLLMQEYNKTHPCKHKRNGRSRPIYARLAYHRLDAKKALIGITHVAYLHKGVKWLRVKLIYNERTSECSYIWKVILTGATTCITNDNKTNPLAPQKIKRRCQTAQQSKPKIAIKNSFLICSCIIVIVTWNNNLWVTWLK